MNITLKYGVNNVLGTDKYSTAADVLADDNLRALWGFAENCQVMVNGEPQEGEFAEGDVAVIVSRANEKQG